MTRRGTGRSIRSPPDVGLVLISVYKQFLLMREEQLLAS